jgi:hypothetical protein
MADTDGELTVAQRLGRALDRGILPAGGPAEAAERLIERLERPARVALLGLPGSGKSSILNLLVGTTVVPETLRLPTIIVQYGEEARMVCTLTDGSTKVVPGSDLEQVLALAPALVTLEMNLPALKVISLLEVSAGPMEAEQRRAAGWASKRADIVIWCSTSYLPKEQTVWESLPDGVKDNSFMFLTKVDLLGSRDSAAAMHDRVEQRAGEEFRQILSISAKMARAAMPAGGPVNRDMFRDSGASAVITAIKTRVQSGRRADMDTAELLLARHVEASELVARRFAELQEETEAPQGWTPPKEPEAGETLRNEKAEAFAPAVEEPVTEPEPVVEAEAYSEPESAPEVEADVYVEQEPEPLIESEVAAAAEEIEAPQVDAEPPEAAVEAADAPIEAEATTKKRFADRIKRVAASSDSASAPQMPLRSTWKSKAETEAAPGPLAAPQQPAKTSPTSASASVESEETARTSARADVVPERRPEPRARTPRAPTPVPAAETARASRPQLFGARRTLQDKHEPESPLRDLSALRAIPKPDEMAEDLPPEEVEAKEPGADLQPVVLPASLDSEPEAATLAPASVFETAHPEDVSRKPVERPRLFDRRQAPRPAEPVSEPLQDQVPRSTPLSRSPAPPRMRTTVPAHPSTPSAQADEAQFSPQSIMMREPRAAPETPPSRRERPRIAARAAATPAPMAAPVPVSSTDRAMVEEAIGVIVSRSFELGQEIDPETRVPVDLVLDHSRETTEQVLSILAGVRTGDLKRINSDLGEVLDLITLMQLEKGHAPADDALTLLLQLKRELETLLAA